MTKEDWQSDRMRWTRNPVYPLSGIGGLNPSSSAKHIAKCLEIRNIRVKKGLLNAHLYVYLSLPKHSDTLVHNDISLMEIHDCIIIISA